MPISTRICRRPGRCTASIRTWTGRRTARRSSSGPAASSGGSIATAARAPKSRSRSTTPASSSIRPGRRSRSRRPASRRGCRASPPSRRTAAGWSTRRSAGSTSASLPAARPRLLTAQDGDFQLWPDWSRDGRSIVFVSWNDQRLGEIRTVAADGSNLRTITQQPGHYRRPRFSPDGAHRRLRAGRRRGADLEPLVGRDRRLPRPRRGRRGDPDHRRRRQPAIRRRSEPRLPRGQRAAEAQADQRRPERRQPARACPGRDGHRLRDFARRPAPRLPRELQPLRHALLRRRPGDGRCRARGAPAADHPRHHQRRRLCELDAERGAARPGRWGRRSTAPIPPTCCEPPRAAPTPRRPPAPRSP